MSRTYDWTLKTQDSGDVWTAYGNLPRPNESFPVGIVGTLIRNQLINGQNSFVQPSNKYNYDDLQFIWYSDTGGTLKDTIEGYVKNATRFKITDHLSNEYVGRFVQVTPIWISGISDEFDITAIFTRETV